MFYDRNSEDLDLPRFNPDDSKPIEQKENDEETQKNMKNKRLIIIAIIAGIILLALIIFLIVYFSLKKNDDGGVIFATHEIDGIKPISILNIENIGENDFEIKNVELKDTVSSSSTRLLTENIYNINKNIFSFNNEKRRGRIKFEIKFKKKLDTMDEMFQNLVHLISADFSAFKSENIKSMNSVFKGCTNLQSVNFNNFNSKKVKSMDSTFENCIELIEIDLSSFETPKLNSMKSTFKNCINLAVLYLDNFQLSNVDTTDIFKGDTIYNIHINDENTKNILNANNSTNNVPECDNVTCEKCSTKGNEKYKCEECREGFYIPNDLKNPTKCRKCFNDCLTCKDEYMKCTNCRTYFLLVNDRCIIDSSSLTDKEHGITDYTDLDTSTEEDEDGQSFSDLN